jgi:phosphoglycolate phosphatase-like HAD superfamily hydrolase
MNRLAIFDIDGTLTDTNGVDDECYRIAVAEAIGVPAQSIDWSGALHVTDAEIFRWLCAAHGRGEPTRETMDRARSRFVDGLTSAHAAEPHRFAEIGGAAEMLSRVAEIGWLVAFATGGWGPSARLKLRSAGIAFDDRVLACADDGTSRADIVQVAHRRAESRFGCRFERVVSIGDGAWDAQTAAALGLPFIGIASGDKAERLRSVGAAVIFADYRDIDAFVAALDAAESPSVIWR